MSKQVGLDLENLYADLTNMAFVKEPEGWMGFQQAWMPGMAYPKKKVSSVSKDQFVGSTSVESGVQSS